MRKFFKGLFIVIAIVVLILGGIFAYKKFFSGNSKKLVDSNKVDKIENYDYNLYDNTNDLYKDLFYELKDTLDKEEIDYDKYAEIVSKMFIVDFYTLSNKVTNQDVGGLDFVYTSIRDNLKTKASDTIYKYVENNVYGERKQELPEVITIDDVDVKKESYEYKSDEEDIDISDDESYIVSLKWSYKKDLGYQKSAELRLVHEDKKLSIVSID